MQEGGSEFCQIDDEGEEREEGREGEPETRRDETDEGFLFWFGQVIPVTIGRIKGLDAELRKANDERTLADCVACGTTAVSECGGKCQSRYCSRVSFRFPPIFVFGLSS